MNHYVAYRMWAGNMRSGKYAAKIVHRAGLGGGWLGVDLNKVSMVEGKGMRGKRMDGDTQSEKGNVGGGEL